MTRSVLVCLAFGSLSWGQEAVSKTVQADQKPAAPSITTPKADESGESRPAKASKVAPDTPAILIDGLCDNPPAGQTDSNCRTAITRTQFEKVIAAVQPNMSAPVRREYALRYANSLVMAKKAEQMGLDKGANYEEQMKLARIQVLSRALNKAIQEKASQISDKDIEDYYQHNTARFERAEMDRIYVPKTRLSDAGQQERSQEPVQTMREEADNLHARAVAGEEFTKLQTEAYQVAGVKSPAPGTSIGIRRTSLPPNQVSVMDLKPGEVSLVLADPSGYVIYKVKAKDTLPLDQAREEIKAFLRSRRIEDEMHSIQDASTPTLDESYFRPTGH